ncbi:hypothetical protein BAUCODRAFT_401651 [Baudoinia panamericana UAMH 10762]|uniref:Uncharacterized protein n=1 Tax=Baudoinia panamericana (strain UAMH 10762) TaxID=717646 RepID=M2MRC2_BAUPA|nr:uncharacterized protein BAUCODRAFT_401651 [Baudoinia panamericana UAMH 10762]EMC99386.1 hypothetical protein BAUCODRAFT_401651 [Baudoinia panamericana UAMH 10762]
MGQTSRLISACPISLSKSEMLVSATARTRRRCGRLICYLTDCEEMRSRLAMLQHIEGCVASHSEVLREWKCRGDLLACGLQKVSEEPHPQFFLQADGKHLFQPLVGAIMRSEWLFRQMLDVKIVTPTLLGERSAYGKSVSTAWV